MSRDRQLPRRENTAACHRRQQSGYLDDGEGNIDDRDLGFAGVGVEKDGGADSQADRYQRDSGHVPRPDEAPQDCDLVDQIEALLLDYTVIQQTRGSRLVGRPSA